VTMSNLVTNDVPRAARWWIVLSVLMMVAGVLAIGIPRIAGFPVGIVVAWLLFFSGLLHLLFAWGSASTDTMLWEAVLGLACTAISLYLLVHPAAALATLALALVIYLLVKSVLDRGRCGPHLAPAGWCGTRSLRSRSPGWSGSRGLRARYG